VVALMDTGRFHVILQTMMPGNRLSSRVCRDVVVVGLAGKVLAEYPSECPSTTKPGNSTICGFWSAEHCSASCKPWFARSDAPRSGQTLPLPKTKATFRSVNCCRLGERDPFSQFP
jgi:hypothetical protein